MATKLYTCELSRDETLQALQAPFKKEAFYTYKKGNDEFTSIKLQYLLDRLNEVCGYGNWEFEHSIIQTIGPSENFAQKIHQDSGMIIEQAGAYMRYAVIKGKLKIYYKNGNNINFIETPEQFGGNADEDDGDAYKGATTDCLIKCCQFLGIAKDMYYNSSVDTTKDSVNRKVDNILKKINSNDKGTQGTS